MANKIATGKNFFNMTDAIPSLKKFAPYES